MSESWFGILEAIRAKFENGKPFTASDVAKVAGIEATDLSSADKIAYAWISKFLKWGYLRGDATTVGTSGRRVKTYAVTTNGEKCQQIEGVSSKLTRLIEAVWIYQRARGTKADAAAFLQLVKSCDEIEKSRKMVPQE